MGNFSINRGGINTNLEGMPSIDLRYGPYPTKQAAIDRLGPNDLDVITEGLTVGIQAAEGAPVVEWWFQPDGQGGLELVEKQVAPVSDAVLYTKQELTESQKSQARSNIGAGTSDFSGDYDDLTNKPTISTDINSDAESNTKTASPKAVKDYVDGKVSSAYKAAGTASSVSNLGSLDASHEGFVYNMSAAFTTTADFVEGAGKTYPSGTNVAIVNVGTAQSPSYKYDVMAGFVDLNNYVQKSPNAGLLRNDGTIDSQTAGKAASALQPKQSGQYTQGNIVVFDANGGLADSQKKTTDFAPIAQAVPTPQSGDEGKILGYETQGGVQWVTRPQDGQDGANGKSAYQLYVDGGGNLSQEAWLASLKANIGNFKFVANVPAVETAFEDATTGGIGTIYTYAIDGITADASTASLILLMNTANATPAKTYMIATQEVTPATTPATYEFVYAGDLQSAMPSNVLTEDYIDDSHLVNPVNTADQNKPVLARAEDVMQLKAKLEGVMAIDTKVSFTNVSSKFVQGADGVLGNNSAMSYTEVALTNGVSSVRFLGYKRNTPSGSGSSGYAFGHYNNGEWVTDRSYFYPTDESLNSPIPFEIIEQSPDGATHFRTTSVFGAPNYLEGFYIYFQSGETVLDNINKVDNKIGYDVEFVEIKTTNQKKYYTTGLGNKELINNSNYSFSQIKVTGYDYVKFLGALMNMEHVTSSSGYAFGYYDNNDTSSEDNWHVIDSNYFDVDTSIGSSTAKEYYIVIPKVEGLVNDVYFRTTSALSNVFEFSDFYCILQNGLQVRNHVDLLQGKIDVINDKINKSTSVLKSITLADANYILRQPQAKGGTETYAEGNRIRVTFYLESKNVDFRNKKYKLQQPNGAGLSFAGFNFSGFINPLGNVNAVETFIENSDYRTDVIEGCFPEKFKCDYLRFVFKKSDNSNFTDAEMQQYLNDFVFEVEGYEEEAPTDTLKYYPLSDFVNGIYINGTGGKLDPNNNRATTKDYLALPYDNVEFKVVVPKGMAVAFGYGNTGNINRQLYYFFNGKDVIFPSGATHFVMSIAYFNGSTWIDKAVSPEEINQMVKNKEIALLYKSNDIVERIDNENAYIEATLFKYKPVISILGQNVPRYIPCFAHGSDTHGDVIRWKNILDFSSHYNLDAVLNTGDNVAHSTQNGMSFVAKLANDYSIRTLITVGNHDTSDKPREGFRTDMNTNLYNEVIKDLCEKESNYYTLPSSSEYDEAPTYYYSDFANKKIRFIAMNLYENGAADPSDGNDGGYGRLSQKQINWLISTLQNTPTDYGILLGYHRAVAPVTPRQGYTKFWQEAFFKQDPASRWKLANVNDYPITQIVDAFINRTHLETSFTQTILNNVVETIEIDADFTNVDASIEFIAHVFGHHHKDSIGYYYHPSDFTPQLNSTQLVLCVCQTTSKYSSSYVSWANVSDVARGYGNTEAQDSFNVYGIDRDAKTVRIARVGANVSSDTLTMRDFMIIPYAD